MTELTDLSVVHEPPGRVGVCRALNVLVTLATSCGASRQRGRWRAVQ